MKAEDWGMKFQRFAFTLRVMVTKMEISSRNSIGFVFSSFRLHPFSSLQHPHSLSGQGQANR
jgi:hypothetical protein